MSYKSNKTLRAAFFVLCLPLLTIVSELHTNTHALSGSEFKAGRIIDDALFYNGEMMTASEIQNFLNSKVPACDTNGEKMYNSTQTRAQYGESKGYPAPYTCLKSYKQDTGYKAGQSGLCSAIEAKTNRTAAQIIDDVARACHISQKAIIVMLQKEQGLVTDDWPWSIQYRGAMGYGCPDTAPCDADYYGFFNQVYNAALQFQRYKADPTYWNHVPFMTNQVQYQANAPSCGSRSTYIENYATAGLYNYTPYTPNQAALDNLYGSAPTNGSIGGSGDPHPNNDGDCSAYGNRNFWRYYRDWFGFTHVTSPYAWSLESADLYIDSSRTQRFSDPVISVAPGAQAYVTVKVRNMGNQKWDPSVVRLGTWNAQDRTSIFASSTWPQANRAAALTEAEVNPSDFGTFSFTITAPAKTGEYIEAFNIVAEGKTWMKDQGLRLKIHVVEPAQPANTLHRLSSGEFLSAGQKLLSQDKHRTLSLQKDGNLVLYSNFKPRWYTGTRSSSIQKLTMQADGNLVLYDAKGSALWHSKTNNNPGAYVVLQTDGNLVIYSSANKALWSTGTSHRPGGLTYVTNEMASGVLLSGQSMETPDRKYYVTLQGDGNLVLYSAGRALWHSKTYGKDPGHLAMQSDGNWVLYDKSGKALWHTSTYGHKGSGVILQGDGNLVIYDKNGRALWHTGTYAR